MTISKHQPNKSLSHDPSSYWPKTDRTIVVDKYLLRFSEDVKPQRRIVLELFTELWNIDDVAKTAGSSEVALPTLSFSSGITASPIALATDWPDGNPMLLPRMRFNERVDRR